MSAALGVRAAPAAARPWPRCRAARRAAGRTTARPRPCRSGTPTGMRAVACWRASATGRPGTWLDASIRRHCRIEPDARRTGARRSSSGRASSSSTRPGRRACRSPDREPACPTAHCARRFVRDPSPSSGHVIHASTADLPTWLSPSDPRVPFVAPATAPRRPDPSGSGNQRSAATRIAIDRVTRRSRHTKRGRRPGPRHPHAAARRGRGHRHRGAHRRQCRHGAHGIARAGPAGRARVRASPVRPAHQGLRPHGRAPARARSRARSGRSSSSPRSRSWSLDATTAVEDRTFWENQGYDLQSTVFATLADVTDAADRGGASTITQQLVRARLLPKELLAPGADLYDPQGQGAHPVGQADGCLPGRGGQAADHHRVPQPDLLRPQRLRHRGRRAGVLRQDDVRADARPGGPARRPAAVTIDPGPVPPLYSKTVKRKGKTRIVVPHLQVRRRPQAHRPRPASSSRPSRAATSSSRRCSTATAAGPR